VTKTVTKKNFHIDKRARQIVDFVNDGDPDETLDTTQTAQLLGVSHQWLEIQRCKTGGPPFIRLAPRMVRYRRADLVKWLKARTHLTTAEYAA